MPRIHFVHAADLHLDTPFTGIAGPAPQVAEALRDASLQAWDDLVAFTIAQGAAALLLAGDVYDGAQRGVRAQLRVLQGLRALSRAGVRTLIVHGNHDPLDGWSAIREWPPGVHVFGHAAVDTVSIAAEDCAPIHVHGISYERRDVADNLAARFRREPTDGVHVGLLHATVGTSSEHASYAPCSLSDLEAAGMDYWALGHIHRRAVLRSGHPWIVYAGDLQGRSPKASETGAKGAYLVTVDTERREILEPAFHALDRVRFVTCPHDLGSASDLAVLQAGLVDALAALRDEHTGRGLLARVVLEGRGPVVHDLRRTDALAQLRDELRRTFADARPMLWVESLADRAAPALDLEAIRARGEFSAEVLSLAERLAATPAELAAFIATRSGHLLTGQTGRHVRDLEPDADAEVLAEALGVVLDRFETAEP